MVDMIGRLEGKIEALKNYELVEKFTKSFENSERDLQEKSQKVLLKNINLLCRLRSLNESKDRKVESETSRIHNRKQTVQNYSIKSCSKTAVSFSKGWFGMLSPYFVI